jgi:hypothetical protein
MLDDCVYDRDDDGVPNEDDVCPDVRDPQQRVVEGGFGAACSVTVDQDGDGVLDIEDDCPADPDPGQDDVDFDGQGDACQQFFADSDGDGLPDHLDFCPWQSPDPAADCAALGGQDEDGDGVVNDEDICPYTANPEQSFDDPCTADIDGDGVLNFLDLCPFAPDPEQPEHVPGLGATCNLPVRG